MEATLKHAMLVNRLELLQAHVAHVGSSPEFEREIEKAQAELQQLEQQLQPKES
jgi:hypothetical protein